MENNHPDILKNEETKKYIHSESYDRLLSMLNDQKMINYEQGKLLSFYKIACHIAYGILIFITIFNVIELLNS